MATRRMSMIERDMAGEDEATAAWDRYSAWAEANPERAAYNPPPTTQADLKAEAKRKAFEQSPKGIFERLTREDAVARSNIGMSEGERQAYIKKHGGWGNWTLSPDGLISKTGIKSDADQLDYDRAQEIETLRKAKSFSQESRELSPKGPAFKTDEWGGTVPMTRKEYNESLAHRDDQLRTSGIIKITGQGDSFTIERTDQEGKTTIETRNMRPSIIEKPKPVPAQPTGPQLESQKIFTGLYTNWMNNNTEGEDHTKINAIEEGVKAREVFKSKYPEPDLYSPQHPAWEKQASAMEKDARDKADYNYKRSNEARKEMWKLAHDKDVRDEVRKTQEENRINAATKAREEGVLKLREEVGKVLQDINNYEATPGERAAYFEGKKKTGDTTIPPTLKLKKAALGDINRRLQSVGMPEMGVETIPEGAEVRIPSWWKPSALESTKKVPTYRVKEGERGAVPQPKPGVRGVAPSTTPLPTPEQAAAELARRRAAKGGR